MVFAGGCMSGKPQEGTATTALAGEGNSVTTTLAKEGTTPAVGGTEPMLAGGGNPVTTTLAKEGTPPAVGGTEPMLAGSWRIYSEAVFYDRGGNDYLSTPSSRLLELRQDGTWTYGGSSGTWSVASIADEDWVRWGISSYGPKRKITLNGWNNGVGEGPMEESGTGVNFFWVIYRVKPPASTWPGQIQIKFGHASL
jgi:hypothetical protein